MGTERRRSIESFFVGTPRAGQSYALAQLVAGWDTHDVFVLRLPVGTGKQRLGLCISDWAAAKTGGGGLSSAYCVPNNALLKQVTDERPSYPKLLGTARYECPELSETSGSCLERKRDAGRHCLVRHLTGPAAIHHPDSCHLVRDLRRSRSDKRLACVYHTLLGHRLASGRDVLIYDEAHNLVKLRQEFAGFSLDMLAARVPDTVWTTDELLAWTATRDADTSPLAETVYRLRSACGGLAPTHLVQIEEGDTVRGRLRRVARAVPVDVSGAPPMTWPRLGHQKVILMTATLGDSDIRQLGLSGRRVLVVDVPSDIPPERRPIHFDPVCRMTYGREETAIRDLTEWLCWAEQEAWPDVRGVIHLPYRLGEMLMRAAADYGSKELLRRLRWFSPTTRGEELKRFLSGADPTAILIAAGCSEGLDLKDDLARFQVIGDSPVASMADPGVRWLHANDPERAEWESVKTMAQTYGRVSRHPNDFGETVVADAAAEPVMRSGLMPPCATEAYR